MASDRYDEIRAALGLPDADRANLAHDLIDSIDSPYDDRSDTDCDADCDAEIRTRVDDIVEGRVETIPGDEVRARLDENREVRARRRGSSSTEDRT